MLGAVRHGGYIPWDDDADILMLRADYEKFKSVCEEELEKKYFFQDADTDPEYLWGYAKLRNLNTTYVRDGQEHIKCKDGVFIDIFPLDDVPDLLPLQMLQDVKCFMLRKILWSKVGCYTEEKRWKRRMYQLLSKISKETVYRKVERMVKANGNSTKRVRCLLFTAPGKHWNKKNNKLSTRYGFQRNWITEREQVSFEGAHLWGTLKYAECLSYLYGDYMKLPPEEKRKGHAPTSKIDLGNEG